MAVPQLSLKEQATVSRSSGLCRRDCCIGEGVDGLALDLQTLWS